MYSIVADIAVTEAAAALPDEALAAYIRVLDVLEVVPWNGEPQHEDNPEGAVRRWCFGADHAGMLVYLIDERDRTVHLLLLVWIS